jgi:hypothetical protein
MSVPIFGKRPASWSRTSSQVAATVAASGWVHVEQRPVTPADFAGVEEERPLQLLPGWHAIEAAVGGRLLIGQELDGHSPHTLWPATVTPPESGETVTFRAGRIGVRWNGQSR